MNYLLISNSYYLIKKQITEISGDSSLIIYDYEEDGNQFLEELSYGSLFDDKKTIIIKNASFFSTLKNDEQLNESLIHYLENPNPLLLLIFVTDKKMDERKKLVKTMRLRGKVSDLIAPSNSELEKLIKEKLSSFKVSPDVINYLLKATQSNVDILINDLNKINLFYQGSDEVIVLKDIKQLVKPILDDNVFNFSNAFITKKYGLAWEIYQDLLLYKIEPINLVILLANQYRLMLRAKTFLSDSKTPEVIAKELNVHPYAIKMAIQNGYSYTIDELKNNLLALADIDYRIKRYNSDRYTLLEMFILKKANS